MTYFWLDRLALGAILSGVMVITAKNPVISVLFLIAVFINVAGYLVLLGVAYLGLVYLIVYVGAIAILFLFVIMMLNLRLVELVDTGQEYTKNLPMAAFIGTLLLSVLSMASQSVLAVFNTVNRALLLPLSSSAEQGHQDNLGLHSRFNNNITDVSMTSFTQIERIGHGLYTYASLWLVVASIIFLLAMVGPIILCMNSASQES